MRFVVLRNLTEKESGNRKLLKEVTEQVQGTAKSDCQGPENEENGKLS